MQVFFQVNNRAVAANPCLNGCHPSQLKLMEMDDPAQKDATEDVRLVCGECQQSTTIGTIEEVVEEWNSENPDMNNR
jgi:hypothetical protein